MDCPRDISVLDVSGLQNGNYDRMSTSDQSGRRQISGRVSGIGGDRKSREGGLGVSQEMGKCGDFKDTWGERERESDMELEGNSIQSIAGYVV